MNEVCQIAQGAAIILNEAARIVLTGHVRVTEVVTTKGVDSERMLVLFGAIVGGLIQHSSGRNRP